MSAITSREENPIPGVEYSEIRIPDEHNLGTGVFSTMLEPKALSKNNPVISSIKNEPVFLLMVTINIGTEEVTAVLGKTVNTPPMSRKVFSIPKETDVQEAHDFTVEFKDWDIKGVILNGERLKPAE